MAYPARMAPLLSVFPSLRFCLFDGVALQRTGNASGRSVVKENKHQRRTGVSRLRAAKSSTAVTCSRVTSNCSIISSMLMPSSRFSKMVATGSRVPRKTHAPQTRYDLEVAEDDIAAKVARDVQPLEAVSAREA